VSVQGSGVLTVAGGAVLVGNNGGNTSNILNPSLINTGGLNFGATPGYFHTASALTVNAPITGSGGVVKSQPGSLILNAVNPFTGGLFVNNGPLQFSTDANLGAAGQPVTLNGGATNGLQFLPSNLFGPATAGNVTVDRPITLGAGGGGVFVSLVNDTLTLSGVVSGPGQLVKAGLGVLNLTGANTYTGNTLVSAGILTAANDAALGGAGSSIVLGGTALGNGVFQPTGSFTTSRDILVSATTVLFTGGQNLTVTGNLTSPGLPGLVTLFKTGTGDLTLTAANTFTGAFQLGESTPTVRATAAAGAQTGGRLILSGANGALASASSVFSISNSELILDNTAVANANRLGNVTLSLIGGNATLLGNAATSVNEQIGALSIANGNNQYGGRLTLVTPAGSGQVTTLTATAPYSAQTAPSVGTLFVRGTNLGATTGDRTAVVLPANPAQTNNMIPSILLATSDTAADPTDFASTATITNAAPNANQFRLVPFATYTAGTGPLGAGVAANTYDVTGAANFASTSAANALRLNNTGTAPSVDLGGGTLTLTAGNVLTTGGANGGMAALAVVAAA